MLRGDLRASSFRPGPPRPRPLRPERKGRTPHIRHPHHRQPPVLDTTTRRWVKAAALHRGDRLRSPGGAVATVTGGYTPKQAAGWMWDLTISGDHDFYVDTVAAPILVHNCSEPEQTFHGRERAADPSRLDPAVQADVIANPTMTLTQADGARVYIQEVDGRYNVVVVGKRGVITNLKTISKSSLNRLVKRYDWIRN